VISLEQCVGCRNGNPTAHASYRTWLVTTTDGGASWRPARRPYSVLDPRFSGSDGWAEGLETARNGGGIARFYVTHDGGRSWRTAPSAAPALGGGDLSVGGDEVWAIGSGCASRCTITVLHAPVGARRLVAAPAQPVAGGGNNVQALAAGPGTAYVNDPDAPGHTFVTHDDGRTWARIALPCPAPATPVIATDGGSTAVWAMCAPRRGSATLTRSIDGGHRWHTATAHLPNGFRLQPASATVAWGVTRGGAVVRTADGGATWRTVWSVADSQPASLRDRAPLLAALATNTPRLTVRDGASATVTMVITRGHVGKQAKLTNFVVYRTSDGGMTWHPSVVLLAGR
jgi:photosystem II stability/assembly factor-like uncharacterized protein